MCSRLPWHNAGICRCKLKPRKLNKTMRACPIFLVSRRPYGAPELLESIDRKSPRYLPSPSGNTGGVFSSGGMGIDGWEKGEQSSPLQGQLSTWYQLVPVLVARSKKPNHDPLCDCFGGVGGMDFFMIVQKVILANRSRWWWLISTLYYTIIYISIHWFPSFSIVFSLCVHFFVRFKIPKTSLPKPPNQHRRQEATSMAPTSLSACRRGGVGLSVQLKTEATNKIIDFWWIVC